MKGKFCVITGATSGIGEAAARALGALGADLVLLGRNEARGNAAAKQIARLPEAGTIRFLRTDLAVPAAVRQTAHTINQLQRPIDILINNAGARFDQFQQNPDGQELTFATNHLGHFLCTGLLLGRILESERGQIITVSSGSHGGANSAGPWTMTAGNYDRRQAYSQSKLANLLFAYELARRLAGTKAVSCAFDPGGVASNFARNNGLMSWAKHLVSHALRRELITPRSAGLALAHLLTHPQCSIVNGGYYHRTSPARSSPASYDESKARALWAFSLALIGSGNLHPCYADQPTR